MGKKNLATYHLIRKAIYITKNIQDWYIHTIIEELQNKHVQILHLHDPNLAYEEWINEIAFIAKNANKKAKTTTTKYAKKCVIKVMSKYRQLYEKNK